MFSFSITSCDFSFSHKFSGQGRVGERHRMKGLYACNGGENTGNV